MDFIFTNVVYRILFYTIIFMSVIISLMVIGLVAVNLYNYKRQRRKKKLTAKYIDWISSYINDEPIKIAKLRTELEFETFAEVSSSSIVDLDGEYANRLKELTKMLKVSEYYMKQTKSRSWGKRYNAIEKLGYLKYQSLKPFFIDYLDSEKNIRVFAKTLIALSLIADKDTIYLINNKINEITETTPLSNKIIEHIYNNAFKNLIHEDRIDDIKEFIDKIEHSPDEHNYLIKSIISSAGTLRIEGINKNLISYYHEIDDPEIQISIIRSLGKIGLKESNQTIIEALKHKSHVVRSVASKYAVNCGYDALNNLKDLLDDENHYVRLNAAKSLALIGDRGIDILNSKKNIDDQLISNTVKYVLDLNDINVLYS